MNLNLLLKYKITLILVLFLFTIPVFSQQAKPFKIRYQARVNGDMTIIANNSVNRENTNDSTTKPYNETSITSKLNDEFKMNYIDIDADPITFSSSSANLSLDNSNAKKIIYAGLYWSATYLYSSGQIVNKDQFEAIDNSRDDFSTIKLKLPNQNNYQDISGELIFDGINEKDFKENAPYVVYADISNLVSGLENPFGTYTVANIKSTIGSISGGVSAGWSIFFVYEDATMKDKFITSYDGFAGITDQLLDINFTGFKTISEGLVNAKIACSALEGDIKLKGDQLLFKTSQSDKFVQLSNSLREKTNIFNSSITIENEPFTDRVPNSTNTLGFDSFIMTIKNPNNAIIANNASDVIIRMKTSGDRYFMFFNAFEVESVTFEKQKETKEVVSSSVESSSDEKPMEKQIVLVKKEPKTRKSKNALTSVESNNEIIQEATISPIETKVNPVDEATKTTIEEIKTIPIDVVQQQDVTPKVEATKAVLEEAKATPIEAVKQQEVSAKVATIQSDENKVASPKPILGPTVSIANVAKGFYIIVNVFSKPANANRCQLELKNKGIKTSLFINPSNNYRYIYIDTTETFDQAVTLYNFYLKEKQLQTLWIMSVNQL